MGTESNAATPEGHPAPGTESSAEVPVIDIAARLSAHQQTRNLIWFSVITFLIYLSAPVLYVDLIHTTLCDKLGASKAVANLPSSAAIFFAMSTPLLVWLVPHTRWLIPMLVGCFGLTAALGAVMTILFVTTDNPNVMIAATISYGGLVGLANRAAGIYRWEALARGVSEARRGRTMSLAFGIGPLFAVLGSMVADRLLNTGIPWLTYPRNFASLFAYSVPVMALAAFICTQFKLSYERAVVKREPIIPFLFGGASDYLRQRQYLILTLSFVLASMAMYVMNNAGLYLKDASGLVPEKLAGKLVALRFGGKVVCGLILGLIYGRFGAGAALMTTVLLLNAAIGWTMTVKGHAYLVAFSLFGGGELLGAYYYTYIVAGSPPQVVKRNTAFLTLAYTAAALGPYSLGRIADHHGLPVSFKAGLLVAAVALLLLFLIPSRPERILTQDAAMDKTA